MDLLEKSRETTCLKVVEYKNRVVWYYKSKVKQITFKSDDLVLHKVMKVSKDDDLVLHKVMKDTEEHISGVLRPTWEGPDQVT